MELYFIRHGIAIDRTAPGLTSDEERWLTEEGIEKMKEVARAFRKLVAPLDAVYTSPLLRAKQTAEIIIQAYKTAPPLIENPLLAPGMDLKSLEKLTRNHHAGDRLAFVGHEPDFSELIALLTAGTAEANIEMKKGAVCRVDVEGIPARGAGWLVWLLPPKALRLSA